MACLWIRGQRVAAPHTELSWITPRCHKSDHNNRRELASAKALWDLQHQEASQSTLVESFSLGWLNQVCSTWAEGAREHKIDG